jgi:hypothetical protein
LGKNYKKMNVYNQILKGILTQMHQGEAVDSFNNHLRPAFHEERRKLIDSVRSTKETISIQGDDYEQVISFLKGRGLPERHLREGSVPQGSLEFIREKVISKLVTTRPLTGLHIGNFVGVSLAFITVSLVKRHPGSLVISIDPNIPHRGIVNPQFHVSALLSACGVQKNSLIVAGYSGSKNVSNDGVIFEGYDPSNEFSGESACEDALSNISRFCPESLDLVFLDGNHNANYLLSEIRQIIPVLRNESFVVLDDVDHYWAEIRDVFHKIPSLGLVILGTDGRVGIAQLKEKFEDR